MLRAYGFSTMEIANYCGNREAKVGICLQIKPT
jgi:hypothetical protein